MKASPTLVVLASWCGLIFSLSCTLLLLMGIPETFCRYVQENIFARQTIVLIDVAELKKGVQHLIDCLKRGQVLLYIALFVNFVAALLFAVNLISIYRVATRTVKSTSQPEQKPSS